MTKIHFFYVKRHAKKNDFLKDVENTEGEDP